MVDSPDKVNDVEEENQGPKITNPNLQYVFNPKRDAFPAKFYFDDGNPEMYTKENIEKREVLQERPDIDNAITKFIETHFTGMKSDKCSKEDYLKIFSQCAEILRRDLPHDDIIGVLREEFDQDCLDKPKKKKK